MAVKISELSNGLKVITEENPSVESVALGMWVDVGSRFETPQENGIAHCLEHMAFKGTTTRSAKEIAETIEAVGGDINAYTSLEVTAYHVRLLKEDLPVAVEVLADILQNSTFLPEEFQKEQAVIIQEIGQSQDAPDELVFEHFQETCFPDQAIGRPILGTAEIIQSLTPGQVKSFMDRHYGAKQMIFSATGNLNHEKVVDLVQTQFNKLTPDLPKERIPAQYKGGESITQRDLEQVHVVLGFEGVPFSHEDYYAISVLATILGGGMSSRLFQEIREKRGLVYSIYSYHAAYRDSGIFGIYAGTGKEQVQELIPVVCKELKTFLSSLTEEEIKRAKAQLKAGLMMSLESTSSRCRQLANQMLLYGRPVPSTEVLQWVEAIDRQALGRIAESLFSSMPTIASLGPVDHVASHEEIHNLLA